MQSLTAPGLNLFNSLPIELTTKILTKIPTSQIKNTLIVNKKLNELVNDLDFLEGKSLRQLNQDKEHSLGVVKDKLWEGGRINKCIYLIKFKTGLTQKIAYFVSQILIYLFNQSELFNRIENEYENSVDKIVRKFKEMYQKQRAFEIICDLLGGEEFCKNLPTVPFATTPYTVTHSDFKSFTCPIMKGTISDDNRYFILSSKENGILTFLIEKKPFTIRGKVGDSGEMSIKRRSPNWGVHQERTESLFGPIECILLSYSEEKITLKKEEFLKRKIKEFKTHLNL